MKRENLCVQWKKKKNKKKIGSRSIWFKKKNSVIFDLNELTHWSRGTTSLIFAMNSFSISTAYNNKISTIDHMSASEREIGFGISSWNKGVTLARFNFFFFNYLLLKWKGNVFSGVRAMEINFKWKTDWKFIYRSIYAQHEA